MLKLNNLLASSAIALTLAILPVGYTHAGFEEAVKAYEAGDYETALKEWMILAQKNDPAAMRNIGHLYRRGLGTEQSYEKAMHWYKRASSFGFARAQANVASMYLRGQGVEQDYVQAADWFTKAARNGHVIAQYNLGLMYEHGKGVEKSVSKALAWYNLAAKAGHPKALDKLSVLVASDPDVKDISAADQASAVAAEEPQQDVKSADAGTNGTKKMTAKPAEGKTEKGNSSVSDEVQKVTSPAVSAADVSTKAADTAVKKPVTKSTPVPSSEPLAKTATPKKIDPFAGSANNNLLAGGQNNTPAVETKGAPTAFNRQQANTASVATKSADSTGGDLANKPPVGVKSQSIPDTKVVDTRSIASKGSVSSEQTTLKPSFVEPVNSGAVQESVTSSAPTEVPIVTPSADVPPKPESKGFFASLKSLITGDDEEEVSSTAVAEPATVAAAPASAIVAPKPKSELKPVEVVVPGAGLTVAERLEMAELSFSLEQYQQALSVWAPLAQEGNAVAQYHLGQMFHEGYAVPVDRVKAHYWWSLAKQNGSSKAAQSLERLEATLTFLEKQQLQTVN